MPATFPQPGSVLSSHAPPARVHDVRSGAVRSRRLQPLWPSWAAEMPDGGVMGDKSDRLMSGPARRGAASGPTAAAAAAHDGSLSKVGVSGPPLIIRYKRAERRRRRHRGDHTAEQRDGH